MTRYCLGCQVSLEGSHFNRKRCAGCVKTWLRACGKAASKKWLLANSERDKKQKQERYLRNREAVISYGNRRRLARAGTTEAGVDAAFSAQDGKCAICDKKFGVAGKRGGLVVDHDHSTGEFRALLCGPCNSGLGMFLDSPRRMEAAAAYVRTHQMRSIMRTEGAVLERR